MHYLLNVGAALAAFLLGLAIFVAFVIGLGGLVHSRTDDPKPRS